MPVSRNRRKTGKAAGGGRKQRPAAGAVPRMVAPPWVVWRHAKDVDPDYATVAAHLPFHIDRTRVTLAQMANESDLDIEDFVDHCYVIAESGLLAWDQRTGTISLPGYRRYEQALATGADEASAMRISMPTAEEAGAWRA